jgi:hypothetical protein
MARVETAGKQWIRFSAKRRNEKALLPIGQNAHATIAIAPRADETFRSTGP